MKIIKIENACDCPYQDDLFRCCLDSDERNKCQKTPGFPERCNLEDAPGKSNARFAIQQGAVADLPAAGGSIVAYKTALLVWDEFLEWAVINNPTPPAFKEYCQQQLTVLAGR
jgi:hypothetical protein